MEAKVNTWEVNAQTVSPRHRGRVLLPRPRCPRRQITTFRVWQTGQMTLFYPLCPHVKGMTKEEGKSNEEMRRTVGADSGHLDGSAQSDMIYQVPAAI